MSERWTWTCADGAGDPVEVVGMTAAFSSREEAESALSSGWEELSDEGAETVSLWCDGELVYGPMSLQEG
ncbi:hypothetical protein SAMN05421595_1491 [Austwickia chelonae]|nr:hypothetical protein [Austwickia chelonae]SEW15003.1 hypothetical protein SAMN05421595_1491 [Austwickia chelonae]